MQQAVTSSNQALDDSACSSSATTINDDSAVDDAGAKVESMDTDSEACELDYNLKLPFKLHKQWVMDQKKADGTCLPDANERRKLKKQRDSVLGGTAGAVSPPSGKRGHSGGSSAEKPLPRRRPTASPEQAERAMNTNPSTEEGVGDIFREVLSGHKLALVPVSFPERRLSEEEAMELRGRILDEVLSAEGVCLQFKRYFPERGALVMLNWLQGLALGLGIGGPGGIGVICGDYKELIRSIKVFLRVDGPMAEDSATILGAIKKQNAGISVSDWRVVGDVHMGDSRTLVILVDEQSSATLKGRNWRVLIGRGVERLIMGVKVLQINLQHNKAASAVFYRRFLVRRFLRGSDTIALINKGLPVLTETEWRICKEISIVLKPFEEVTKNVSGEHYVTRNKLYYL
ncbi:hypothetical protein J6590_046914 [Homalodisca vitripennis]|nr:hypothetical protein J6590_046914 [Homalodisca vitripennis]